MKSKIEKFLDVARSIAMSSPCSRRKFGAILVKHGIIIGTGYNGTARGTLNCGIDIPCIKDAVNEPHNISYDYCPAIHAEENAIMNSNPIDRVDSTMFLAPLDDGSGDRPCFKCRRKLLNGLVYDIYYIDREGKIKHEFIKDYIDMDNRWMTDHIDKVKPNWIEEMIE